ncbi:MULTISPECIES: hypothetical protein [unclassified Paenibacillus]|uniref:hypothetical protein n=1 Tax=unclassified Paenibacillus TaxID=185978 RepID=UPI001AE6770A|nr:MULTISPECIES: hypothetical protein [unclassified Paenibacillus]MBP1157200.1 hypothetical protein [Paenibacillus sp. PvP091]MBP1172061.1 hypothetical protein [Paenibacillus sp. PvR098]MBP2438442.1 hypothetical protein [Paenibacillus sp. PvP052]
MNKSKYYVSVQAATILENQGDAAYEFEIEATPEEILKLEELFEERLDIEDDNYIRAHIPGVPYHHDAPNDQYELSLHDIYSLVYDLGTAETKKHIESMQILT